MNISDFNMRVLLERSGFRVRGATRADCIHCEGQSRGTVAFTHEVAFCHRCKWAVNKLKLARELGLLRGDAQAMSVFREEARQRLTLGSEIKRFETWREVKLRNVSNQYRSLSRGAVCASKVLAECPNCEDAWAALAHFYQVEAQLSAAFDWLMFTKAGAYLEKDSTPLEVFKAWRNDVT
jgi:hypothetical protein